MAERIDNIKLQEMITKIKTENPSISDEQIISILNNSTEGIKLTQEQLISIIQPQSSEEPSLENKSEQRLAQLKARVDKIKNSIAEAEKNNGFIGNLWSRIKNSTGIGDSSNDIRSAHKAETDSLAKGDLRTAFFEITGVEYNEENFNKFLKEEIKTKSETALEEYKIGQEDSSDIAGDMLSGIASTGLYTFAIAAVATMGAPIALAAGVALTGAAVIGAGIKVATKAGDAALGEKKYNTLGKDIVTGAVNGIIAPIATCFGGKIAASLVSNMGGQAIKEGTKIAAKEAIEETSEGFFKGALLNPMGNVYKGNFTQKATGYIVELGFDGGVSGGADAATRAAYDGKSIEEIGTEALYGAGFGAIGGITLGGAMKAVGNYAHNKGVDVGNNIKPKATTNLPRKISSLEDVFKKSKITTSEAVEILKKYGFTEEEYLALPQTEKLNEIIRLGEFFADSEFGIGFKNKTKTEILEIFQMSEEDFKSLQYSQFLNEENLKIIQQLNNYNETDAKRNLVDLLTNSSYPEKDICKYYELSRELDYPINLLMNYISNPNTISIENLKIQKVIADIEGNDFYPYEYFTIDDPQKITKEFLEEYSTVSNALKARGLSIGSNSNPIKDLNEGKEILSCIDGMNLDFQHAGINTRNITKALKKYSPETLRDFVNGLSDECKELYRYEIFNHFLTDEHNFNLEPQKCIDFFNTIAEIKTLREHGKDSFQCNYLLDAPNTTIKDAVDSGLSIEELTLFFKGCKDMDWVPENSYFFRQLKPDVDLSLKTLKEIKAFCDSEYGKSLQFETFARNVFNGFDCTQATADNFKRLLTEKIHIHSTYLMGTFCKNANSIDNYILLTKNGIIIDNTSTTCKMLSDFTPKQIQESLKILKLLINNTDSKIDTNTLFFLTNQQFQNTEYILNDLLKCERYDDGSVARYLYNVKMVKQKLELTEGLEEFCNRLINDKELNFPSKYISGVVMNVQSDNFDIIKRICTDKKYSKFWNEELEQLCDYINPRNTHLFEKLCDTEIAPRLITKIIKSSTTDKHSELAYHLCFDKNVKFPLQKIPTLLNNYQQECTEALLSLCKENPQNFGSQQIIELAKTLNQNTIAFFNDMCRKSDIFSSTSITDTMAAINDSNINFAQKAIDKNISQLGDILFFVNEYNKDLADYLVFEHSKSPSVENLKNILEGTTASRALDFATRLCKTKDVDLKLAGDILKAKGTRYCKDFIETLCFDKEINFPKSEIPVIARRVSPLENLDLAIKLCTDKNLNWEPDKIADILYYTIAENMETVTKLCYTPAFPRELIANTALKIKKGNIPLVEQALATKGLNLEHLPKILECATCKDDINRGYIDEKKVKVFINLLQNPKTSDFVVKLLDDGFDMDTIAFLSKTKQKIATEATTSTASITTKTKPDFSTAQLDSYDVFTAHGLSEKEASAIIKAISTDGNIDPNMQTKALALIDQSIAKNKIGDILNQSKITGEYNPKIVDDFVALQNLGLNPLLEKNLAVINNISGHDTFFKFNPKVKKQMLGMISGLTDQQKATLSNIGIDTNDIIKKLEIKVENSNVGKVKVKSGLRSKSSLEGFEKIIVNKYNPAENIWRNPEACKIWANEKYLEYKAQDYSSRLYPNANADRTRILNDWFEFLDNEEVIKENPFAKILVTEFITRELEPENAWLPPEFDKEIAKDLLNSALENSQEVSFSKAYKEKLKAKSQIGTEKEEVFVDGIKGTWYTVPQTDKSSPNFKANVEKIKTFSDGTNWCIRTFNAEPYTQQGAMHFFVDENGLTQVCIRERGHKSVAEIQKRQQDQHLPIPYINVIQDFIERKELYTQRGYLNEAIAAKPKFDKIRAKLNSLVEQGDYKGILEAMLISVKVNEDGTWTLSHYSPDIDQFKLAEFGIKEDLLLQNVSRIEGYANFNNSNATALPNLKEVTGTFTFDESQIGDVRNLEVINGKKIKWN